MGWVRFACGALLCLGASHASAGGFAMSDNFTVFTPAYPTRQDAQAYAQEVLRSAEAWRREIAIEWVGEELPPSVGKTTVNVSFSEDRDAGRTWATANRRLEYHTLYLTTTPDRALSSTLAHEMVHVVLATRFPAPRRLPAWIEEGIASRYDDRGRRLTRQRIVLWMARTDNWVAIESILDSPNIASSNQAAYTVASSVVEYLLSQADRQTLLEFGLQGARGGWDAALQRYYRIRNVAELQQRWQTWAAEPS